MPAESFEIQRNKHDDVTKPKVFSRFKKLVTQGKVSGLWLGLTCASFSRARRGRPDYSGWPPPLRGDDPAHIWGLKGLSKADQDRVSLGNKLVLHSLRYIKLCVKHGVPCFLENPLTSRLWLVPPLQCLIRRCSTVLTFDHCQYGSPYRKPTKVLCWNIDASGLDCRCSPCEGLCSYSKQKHVQLSGSSKGEFRTAWGSPYPLAFAEAVVRRIKSQISGCSEK